MKKNSSIIYQVLFLLVFSAIIIFSIGVTVFFFFEKTEKYSELQDESKIITDRLINNLAIPLWNFHTDQLETIIKHEINNKFVFAIIIYDRDDVIDRGQIKNGDEIVQYTEKLKYLLTRATFK
ncbi:MAG: hypothetical protein JW982_04925, partial [Spirochaetes bacterium]|nr:hypothetical protein [Spirochaetota bacterium]